MRIDHICIAVKNLEDGIKYWEETFGYIQKTRPVTNTRQKVKVVFISKPDSLIVKLIEPLEDNTPLVNFVKMGGGFHHVCFICEDVEKKTAELKAKGVRLLVRPEPGEAFNNHDIAFFMGRNRLNFELIDTEEKAEILT